LAANYFVEKRGDKAGRIRLATIAEIPLRFNR
jgi:hypothetical protein